MDGERKDAAAELIGVAMADVRARLRAHARSSSPVLISGEHGTGKKVAARILHALSDRSAGPFLGFDCAACSELLFASELFGQESSMLSRSGCRRVVQPGRVEQATGGTLFFWHVGELSYAQQQALLRLFAGPSFERVGGREKLTADVRVVATTSHPLQILVKTGDFYPQLADLLESVEIALPPLRERMSDLELLVGRFLEPHDVTITPSALEYLATLSWGENVAELEAFLASLVARVGAGAQLDEATVRSEPRIAPPKRFGRVEQVAADQAIAQDALQKANGDHAAAAQLLGVSPRRLNYLLRGPPY